ncbi:hypothetical protein MAR_024096 [Mya arenaria]|uniref:Uncharacterized protein n=1 Tax=Mya arenaria TaxID=6604 RepID=A0ABY7DRI8_MYAAR|nr:hypothetical protein MAR_024096 [Mya arenaria]
MRLALECDTIPGPFLKQRSEEWFEMRKTTKVTGSVAHIALGLESLNKQKVFIESVFSNVPHPEPTEQQQRAMNKWFQT